MKKFIKPFIISAFLFLVMPDNLFAQGPPPWAPAHGYRAKTRHIYFPDQNVYFDLHRNVYLTLDHGIWISLPKPPRIFVGININTAPKIELDFSGDRPYTQNSVHIVKYKKPKKAKKVRVVSPNVNIINVNINGGNGHDHGGHGRGHGNGHGKGKH